VLWTPGKRLKAGRNEVECLQNQGSSRNPRRDAPKPWGICDHESMDIGNQATIGGWWFALTLVNAGLAESKGRGRLIWWLLSLVLGPLATFLIVVMPRGTIPS